MTTGSAWVDYIDARRRLVHEWHEQGVSNEDIAIRIELDAERIASIIGQPVDPPFPGSARAQVREWRTRATALEAEIHAAGAVPSEPPKESGFHALLLHADPECCGCQHWTDHPPSGQHHPLCEHAPKARP